jgi:predicted HicB family RNase H-like nuclease
VDCKTPKIILAFFFLSFNNGAMKMKTTSIKLSEALHRAAKTAAISAGMTFQQWVETAFQSYLKKSK